LYNVARVLFHSAIFFIQCGGLCFLVHKPWKFVKNCDKLLPKNKKNDIIYFCGYGLNILARLKDRATEWSVGYERCDV